MIVALTGATGLLGVATLECLLSAGHHVRALVRGRADRDLPHRPDLEWIDGGLDDRAALDTLVHRTDAIMHVAYCPMEETPPPGRSVGEHFIQTNVVGTLRLVERTPATRLRQLVYVSSLAVYGTSAHQAPAAARVPLDEDFPLWPREFYAAHKAALEKMIIAGSGDPDMNTSVFRVGCILGDYRQLSRNPLAGIVGEAVQFSEIRTRAGAHVITADDTAAVLAAALGDTGVRGQVYNTFDRWLDFASLAPVLSDVLGREIRVACDPAPEPRPPILNDRLLARGPTWRTDQRLRAALTTLVARFERDRRSP